MIQDSSLWKRFLVGLLMGLILFLSASGSNSNVKITFTSSRYGNDEIYIIGTHTETYLRQEIKSIQIKQKKNLTETPYVSSKEKRITVGITLDKPVKKNDKIFKLE